MENPTTYAVEPGNINRPGPTGLTVRRNTGLAVDKKSGFTRSKKGSVSSEMAQFEELQGRVSNPVHWSNGVPVSVDDFNMHTLLVLENVLKKFDV